MPLHMEDFRATESLAIFLFHLRIRDEELALGYEFHHQSHKTTKEKKRKKPEAYLVSAKENSRI